MTQEKQQQYYVMTAPTYETFPVPVGKDGKPVEPGCSGYREQHILFQLENPARLESVDSLVKALLGAGSGSHCAVPPPLRMIQRKLSEQPYVLEAKLLDSR